MSLGAKSRRRRRPQADAGGHLPPMAFAPGAPVVKAATLSTHRLRRALTRRFAPPSPAGGRRAASMRASAEAAHQRPRILPVELQVSPNEHVGLPAFPVLYPHRNAQAGGEGAGGWRVASALRPAPQPKP